MTAEIDYITLESSIQSATTANNSLAVDLLLQTHPAYKALDQYLHTYSALIKSDVVKVLLKHGASPNTVTPNDRPIIVLASCCGYLNTVKVLIVAGADVNAIDGVDGTTALRFP
jgi:ankyrin repeat protein